MQIAIGTQYIIRPAEKKSLLVAEELEALTGDIVEIETLWRDGAIAITPRNDDEVAMLQVAIDRSASGENKKFTTYGDELIEATDACSVAIDNPEYDADDCSEMEQVGVCITIFGPILIEAK